MATVPAPQARWRGVSAAVAIGADAASLGVEGGAMVERRPVRLSSNLTRITPPPAPTPPGGGNSNGCTALLVVAGLVAVLAAIGRCSSGDVPAASGNSTTAEIGNAQQALVSAVAAQTPPPVRPLDRGAVGRGVTRVRLASVEGLDGEMVYSQNCYDALGRAFSWRKLDECGGFDVAAGRHRGEEDGVGMEKAGAWFDDEAAAGRYLKAATAAGEPADEADRRLAALQSRVDSRAPAKPAAGNDAGDPSSDGSGQAANAADIG